MLVDVEREPIIATELGTDALHHVDAIVRQQVVPKDYRLEIMFEEGEIMRVHIFVTNARTDARTKHHLDRNGSHWSQSTFRWKHDFTHVHFEINIK